jgi:hypothetical protein
MTWASDSAWMAIHSILLALLVLASLYVPA